MDMNPIEFKLLTSTCRNKNYQPLTIDMTKDKNTGRYRLGLRVYLFLIVLLFELIK